MMRNHTPKIKKSVIPEQHIQYFSSRATGSAEKNFTELLAARDKHILRRRFAAETLGGLLEPVVDTKDRVRLAIKYYGFLKLRRYSMRQYS